MTNTDVSREEKISHLRSIGDILDSPFGPLFRLDRLSEHCGVELRPKGSRDLPLTDEQKKQAREKFDALAAEIGSRNMIDVLFHLATRAA